MDDVALLLIIVNVALAGAVYAEFRGAFSDSGREPAPGLRADAHGRAGAVRSRSRAVSWRGSGRR